VNPSPGQGPSPKAEDNWLVFRQDDNGNRFEVARNLSREAALEMVERLEALGHKQSYSAVRDKDSGHE
jgi:hypothetical protein